MTAGGETTQAQETRTAPVADKVSAWSWRLEGAAGEDAVATGAARTPPAFARRFDAEVWLGARWRSLAAAGVTRCVLQRGGSDVAAPLPLPRTHLMGEASGGSV